MHWFLIVLFSTTVLTVVYYLCYFALAITFGVNNRHYFLGFGKGLFEFKVKDVLFTVGIFVPVFGLARFYKVEDYARQRPDYPWQFSDRPLLIRALVTYGGAMSLFLTALIILVSVRFVVSEQFISREDINKHGIYPSTLAEQYGFKRGDKVLTVNGRDFQSYNELMDPDVYAAAGNTFKVVRDGEELIIRVPEGDHDLAAGQLFLEVLVPVVVDSVLAGSAAEEIRLQKGDRIVRVNDARIDKTDDMREAFFKDVDGTVELQIQRIIKNDTATINAAAQLDERQNLGIFTRQINYTARKNSFFEALEKGARATLRLIAAQVRLWLGMNNNSARKSGGPVRISSVLGGGPNWEVFWYMIANWAVVFATWNLFPFPRSAFWETIPLVYEGLTRRKFSYSLFRHSRPLGWIIFWGLILFSLVMDIIKLF